MKTEITDGDKRLRWDRWTLCGIVGVMMLIVACTPGSTGGSDNKVPEIVWTATAKATATDLTVEPNILLKQVINIRNVQSPDAFATGYLFADGPVDLLPHILYAVLPCEWNLGPGGGNPHSDVQTGINVARWLRLVGPENAGTNAGWASCWHAKFPKAPVSSGTWCPPPSDIPGYVHCLLAQP